ncbi:MAG: hypothetical protein R3E84_18300 [Pseudomonadales bacterium]
MEALADFVDRHGATRDEFLAHVQLTDHPPRHCSPAGHAAQVPGCSGVPTLVVGGKYLVKMEVGRKLSLAVVDLVKLEQADKPVVKRTFRRQLIRRPTFQGQCQSNAAWFAEAARMRAVYPSRGSLPKKKPPGLRFLTGEVACPYGKLPVRRLIARGSVQEIRRR